MYTYLLSFRDKLRVFELSDKAIVFCFFFHFLFYRFFSQQVRVGGRNKNKFVFPSILIQLENGPNEFIFLFY